ncbi:MAG: hypothetical protein WDZ31_09755 [Phycisphaeraceae bacterium]
MARVPHADDAAQPDQQAELDRTADRHASIICANCVSENGPFEHFCHQCGLPLTAYATIAPLEQVYTLGHGYREATDHPTRPIIFYGLWLLLGPQVLLFAIGLLGYMGSLMLGPPSAIGGAASPVDATPLGGPTDPTAQGLEWVGTALVAGLLVIYIAILYKATRNYLRRPATT